MSHYTSSCFSKCTSISFLWCLFNITSSELFNEQTYGLNKANTSTRTYICLIKTLQTFCSSYLRSLSLKPWQCERAAAFRPTWWTLWVGRVLPEFTFTSFLCSTAPLYLLCFFFYNQRPELFPVFYILFTAIQFSARSYFCVLGQHVAYCQWLLV